MTRTALAVLLALAAPLPARADTAAAQGLVLKSDSLAIRPGARTAIARGNVVATSPDFELRCGEAEATYGASGDAARRSVEVLAVRDDVRVRRAADGLEAESGEARYVRASATVELAGDPVVRRGADVLEGERMVLGVADDSLEVDRARVRLARRDGAPVDLRSDRLSVTDRGARARFEGRVHATDGTVVTRADRADVLLDTGGAEGPSGVRRLSLSGSVRITRGAQQAKAQRATWEASSGEFVLEGDPVVEENGEKLSGARIVIGPQGNARVEQAVVRVRRRR